MTSARFRLSLGARPATMAGAEVESAVRGYYQRIADMLDLDRMGERLSGPPASRFLARHGYRIRRALPWCMVLLGVAAALVFAGDLPCSATA